MAKIIIGILGPGEHATERDCLVARELGRLIAAKGWVLLTGGRRHGVMHAASEGAKAGGGLTIGILSSTEPDNVSSAVDIPILTGFGEGRNIVNVLTSRVVLVCGMSAGTASEVAYGLKTGRPVVLVGAEPATAAFFKSLGHAIRIVEELLRGDDPNAG
jgi:uncharacterized protein (TIGR00725 family)